MEVIKPEKSPLIVYVLNNVLEFVPHLALEKIMKKLENKKKAEKEQLLNGLVHGLKVWAKGGNIISD